jgi:flagellar motor switch protein FliM
MAYETFARRWATLLTTSLRTVCTVQLGTIEQVTYDEYVAGLSTPTTMTLLTLDPVPGTGVLEISLPATMATIDHLLGGPGGPDQPARPLTDLETELVRGVLTRLLGELRYAFESLVPMRPAIGALEHNPQFAQAAGASDMVVVATFDLRVGTLESTASVCLPYSGIVPHLQVAMGQGALSERERASRAEFTAALRESLLGVNLEVAVQFRPAQLTPAAVLDLTVGDVITLPHRTSTPLTVTAGGVTFGYAVPGSHGRRLAALVVEPPQEETP